MKGLIEVLVALGLAAAAALGADNSLGKWRLNVWKSGLMVDGVFVRDYFTSEEMEREAWGDGVKVTDSFKVADRHGTVSYTVKYDGMPSTLTDTAVLKYDGTASSAGFDRISIKQLGANTFTSQRQNTGTPFHAEGRIVISRHGKVMTEKTKGISNSGRKFTMTRAFDRQ